MPRSSETAVPSAIGGAKGIFPDLFMRSAVSEKTKDIMMHAKPLRKPRCSITMKISLMSPPPSVSFRKRCSAISVRINRTKEFKYHLIKIEGLSQLPIFILSNQKELRYSLFGILHE